jgi:hypothetical protein
LCESLSRTGKLPTTCSKNAEWVGAYGNPHFAFGL